VGADDDEIGAAGGGGQRLEHRPVQHLGADAPVDAGLTDRPEHLGLQPVVRSEPAPQEQPAPLERIAVGLVEDQDGDDRGFPAGGLAERPDQGALRGRRAVHLDDEPGVLPARQQRGEAQR
jgi:hypothetical protein